jgi:hypothetical protein
VTAGGHIELQYKETSATDFSASSQFSGSTTTATVGNVNDGVNYTVQIRSISVSGSYGNWIQASIAASNANSTLKATSITP